MYSGFVIALALMIFATLYKQRATRIALGINGLILFNDPRWLLAAKQGN